jgi:hypothetical protein
MGYAEESLIASDPYSGDISANLMNQFMLIADGIALKSPKTKDSFNKAIESLKSSIKKPVVKCIYETTVSGKNSRETCPSSGYSKVPMKPLSEVMSKNFDSQRISYAEEVLSNGGENGFKLSSEQKDAIWAAHKAKGLRAKIKKLRAEFDECQYNELIRRGICGEEDVKLNELFSNLKEQLKDDGLNEDAEAFLRDELNDLLLSTRSGKREDGQIIPSDGSELLGSGKKFSFRININSKGGNIESFKIELLRPEQSPITVKQITDEFDLEAIKNLRDGLDMGKIKPDPIEENKFSADLKDKKGNVRRLIFEKDASGKHKIIGEIKEKVTGISGNINCQKTSVSTRPRSPVNPTRWNLAKEWLDNPSPPDMTKTRDLEGMAVEMGYIVREFGDTEGKRIINPLNNDHIGTIVRSRTTSNGVAEHTIRALSVGRWLNRGERP